MAYSSGLYGLIHTINQVIVSDATTGQQLLNEFIAGSAGNLAVRAQVLGSKFIFVFSNANEIGYVYVDTAAPTVMSAPVILVTDYNGNGIGSCLFDCKTVGLNLVFSYGDMSGQISSFYLNSSLIKSATFKVNVDPYAIGIFDDATGDIWVGNVVDLGGSSYSVNYFIINPTVTATILGQTNIDILAPSDASSVPNIGGVYDGANGNFFYGVDSPTGLTSLSYTKKATYSVVGAPISAASVLLRSVGPYSKPFIYGGNIYIVVAYISQLQPTYFLINKSGRVAAKFSSGVATEASNEARLIDVVQLSETEFTLPFTEFDAINIGPGNPIANQDGISQIFFYFNSPTIFSNIGQNLEMGGGVLSMYDGVNTVEHGFNLYPEDINAVYHSSGGSLGFITPAPSQYQYKVTYEWTDAQGQLHRSAPSIAITVGPTTTNTGSVDLNIPTLRVTDKKDVLIVVYRTVLNGTQFYQITPTPTSGTAVKNNTAVDFVSFTDTLADAAIIGNNQLYTNGGEFENIEVPATNIFWTYQNRLLCVYEENPLTIGFSKQVIQGVPVEFNDEFTIIVPENDGGVTAGIQMDDKCIIFKYNTIYYMVGQGPSDNGQNNDFTTPLVISTDCGCIDKKSVVLMPIGVMFKSTKGIYLLDRSLNVKYIGADVEAYNDDEITSAKIIEGVNQIRFTLGSGVSLVYDYYYNLWDIFDNINAVDSCIFQNTYTYLRPSGMVLQEAQNSYDDDGDFIPISFTTAWFSFAKIQGFQRAYKMLILGQYYSPHTLKIELAVNFDPTIVQTVYIPSNAPITPYQYRLFITQQKCESYQITVTEQQDGPNYGQGLSLSEFTFEVGGKKGLYKMPSANSYG